MVLKNKIPKPSVGARGSDLAAVPQSVRLSTIGRTLGIAAERNKQLRNNCHDLTDISEVKYF